MNSQNEQQFITNKQLFDEIREKQKIHDERLEEHELKIERNRLEIEQIKNIAGFVGVHHIEKRDLHFL